MPITMWICSRGRLPPSAGGRLRAGADRKLLSPAAGGVRAPLRTGSGDLGLQAPPALLLAPALLRAASLVVLQLDPGGVGDARDRPAATWV